MASKINISYNGKSFQKEIESESLLRNKIGDKVKGESFFPELEGYELEITGTSDQSGFPGIKGQIGAHLRKVLLTKNDKGMKNRKKGLRLRKSVRGEEISEKTSQINMNVLKEGRKKWNEVCPVKPAEAKEEKPKVEKKEETAKAGEKLKEKEEKAKVKKEEPANPAKKEEKTEASAKNKAKEK